MKLSLTNKSVSLTVAFKLAAASDWASTLEPYKQFFTKTYGEVSYLPRYKLMSIYQLSYCEILRISENSSQILKSLAVYITL